MPKLVLFVLNILIAFGAAAQDLTLADLERMALAKNPALQRADAAIRAAEGERLQAGLYPNPFVGVRGEEVTPGPIIRGGEYGPYVEQRFVTGGKLRIQKQIADVGRSRAQAELEAERLRVVTSVRVLYYEALGQQRLLEVRTELAKLADRAVQTTSELMNVGQADRPDLLAVQVEAQRLQLGLTTAHNGLHRIWRQLAAATGVVTLTQVRLDGDLEKIPPVDFDSALEEIYRSSPELRLTELGIQAAEGALRQERAAVIPDLTVRGGIHYNRELLELNQQAVGWQGSFEAGMQVPLFNRNQGAIAAARARQEISARDADRVRLSLRARLAQVFGEYQDARAAAERYRAEMIPKAREAFELYSGNFRQMAAAYPQVLISQRNYFQVQEDYLTVLVSAAQRAAEIQGLLPGLSH